MRPFLHDGVAPARWRRRSFCAAAWAACMLACIVLTHVTHYRLHDPDSRLYAAMAKDLAARPVQLWCAPTWNGHWQRDGLFYEHPPGLLWAGAALIRLGVQPEQALYICNFATLFGGLGLLWAIGEALRQRSPGADTGTPLGMAAVGLWVMTPAFLQYLVRGNQEHPLCFAVLLGIWALVGRHNAPVAALAWALALGLGVAVKGIAAAALLPIALPCLALRRAHPQSLQRRAAAVVAGTAACGLAMAAFDAWARRVTGASFWAHYMAGQVQHSVGAAGLVHKLGNLVYYAARPLWFGLPAVALLAVHASRRMRRARRASDVHGRRLPDASVLGLAVAFIFVAGFSLANRKADRYLFPIYPALALAAAAAVLQAPAARARMAAWRHVLPYALMVFLPVAVAVKIYVGTHHYFNIRWWPGA